MSRLIDADALIAQCGNWYIEEGTEEGFIGTLKQLIDLMPTIEPERKMGEWKNVGFLTCQCSECGAQFHELEYTNYCPNCGADMRGKEQHETD